MGSRKTATLGKDMNYSGETKVLVELRELQGGGEMEICFQNS